MTASSNVNVAVKAPETGSLEPVVIAKVGGTVSLMTWMELLFVPVTVVLTRALPARSLIVGLAASARVTVALRSAMSPPARDTSNLLLVNELTVGVAVVPVATKSAPEIVDRSRSSLKSTCQETMSASVGETTPKKSSTDDIVGAVSSLAMENWVAAVLPLPAASCATAAATSTVTLPSAAGVIVAV